MKKSHLAILLALEACIGAVVLFYALQLRGWSRVPEAELAKSPDAFHSIGLLSSREAFLSGVLVGMAMCVLLELTGLTGRRNEDAAGGRLAQWLALALPIGALIAAYVIGT